MRVSVNPSLACARLVDPAIVGAAVGGCPYPPTVLRAVLFDVDFTLSRPGPELGPDAYRLVGERHGLDLRAELYEPARLAALADLRTHPELEHDEEIWI